MSISLDRTRGVDSQARTPVAAFWVDSSRSGVLRPAKAPYKVDSPSLVSGFEIFTERGETVEDTKCIDAR